MLSNWHVLHGPDGTLGDDLVQPGPHDDNRTDRNRLGRLTRSHLGVAGDCAIATIDDRTFDTEILELGVVPDQLGEPELGDRVVKSGRTTGVTRGVVRRVDTIAKLDYGGTVGERNIGCFEIGPDPDHPAPEEEISRGGDSGAVWMFTRDDQPHPVWSTRPTGTTPPGAHRRPATAGRSGSRGGRGPDAACARPRAAAASRR